MTFDGRLLSGISVLAAVVQAGSFVRAGRVIGMTQSGVSRTIARLEARIGVRLLDRTSRAMKLTEAGRRFYEGISYHLDGIEEIAGEARAGARTVKGKLRVSADAAFGHYLLAPNLGRLLEIYPELHVEMVVRDRIGDLVTEGFDLAIRFGRPESSVSNHRVLMNARVLTCASPEYMAKRGLPRHPDDLVNHGHECIGIFNANTGRPYTWDLQRGDEIRTVTVNGRLLVNDSGSLLGAMLAGHGIGQPLDFMVRDHLAAGRLVQLLPDWADELFPVCVYHRSHAAPSAKVRTFLDFLFPPTLPRAASIHLAA